tara:strand:- start:142 stop:393 length:252 start_codon:yes stop_codon:yes gene_type:complete
MVTREKLKDWILLCLKVNGGKAWPKDVSKYIWEEYEQDLKASGSLLCTWQYDVRWAAQKLRHDGILKPVNGRRDLPWELAEKG